MRMNISYLSERGWGTDIPAQKGTVCIRQLEEFQGASSIGKDEEGMEQGLRGQWGFGGFTEASVLPSICCLCYPFLINIFLWNKMGYKLKVIILGCITSWLHQTLHENIFPHISPPRLAQVHWGSLQTQVCWPTLKWDCGLENTDWLCSHGIWRLMLFLLCSTSRSRVRVFFRH